MLKTIGFIFMIISSAFLGKALSDKRRFKLSAVEDAVASVHIFKTLLKYENMPIEEALYHSSVASFSRVLEEPSLFGKDERVLSAFLKGTRSESLDGQLKNADLFLERLKGIEKSEKEKYEKEEKLIKKGAVLLGLLLFVILI